MNEMADVAYWHAVEELQSSPDRYWGSSSYYVLKVGTGELLGTISRSIFNEETDEPPRPTPMKGRSTRMRMERTLLSTCPE